MVEAEEKAEAQAEEKCQTKGLDLQLQLQEPQCVLVEVLCTKSIVVLLQMNLQLQVF